ncbi:MULTISPECIES: hypothetical protein [Acidiphilium]|uniref:Uncharacterized protein n=1 Tax=Acidiphilium iwatense TaxID=768198 RepID=A0ABS9DWJ2_9PROT|nr:MULTISPECIES: hypothetical protein [Acidiphilium]MCF3945674.1 hypothetical protein [Acidiphilium iwatense]
MIVHDREHVAAALAVGLPVTLLSPPGFALYAGCLWWQALLEQAGFTGFSLLDCADAPGRAIEALRLGLHGIVLDAEPVIFARVAAIAAESGAILLDKPPPSLDLAQRGADRRLAGWLGGAGEFG